MSHPLIYRIAYLLRITSFFLLFFFFWRIVFYSINSELLFTDFKDLLLSQCYGMRMDLATIGYLTALLSIVFLFTDFTNQHNLFFGIVIWLTTTVFTLAAIGNVCVYHVWGTMLNYRAVTYLKDPGAIVASLTAWQGLVLLSVVIIFILLTGKLTLRWLKPNKEIQPLRIKQKAIIFFSWAALSITVIRGGWQQLPLNESNVYFSQDAFINHTAVNPVWHLFNDIKMAGITNHNPFERMSEQEARKRVQNNLIHQTDSAFRILKNNRPNIVVIMLESFSANLIESMGGEKGVTPGLDSLIGHGLLFNRIYSSGFRTDQGIVSVLNGWPATSFHSIMRSTDKAERLPSLPKLLKQNGYKTAFYYGGAPNFSNLGAYLNTQQFDRVITQQSFNENELHGQWGFHDEVVLSKQLNDATANATPFFDVVMTLSNHEPYDVPGQKKFIGDDEVIKFKNAAAYTDAALKNYFNQAEKTSWFKNTLFVIVADHGHYLPKKTTITYPSGRWIPMVLAGNVLSDAFIGVRDSVMGGHHDLAATILSQMDISSASFHWSKNLLSQQVHSFAYLPIENYLVWNQPDGWFFYSYDGKKVIERSFAGHRKESNEELMDALAFMQMHYGDYLKY